MDPLTALAALLPLGIEAGKAAIQRFIVPETVKPATFADQLQARGLDLEFFKAMQGGDSGPAWVQAVRSLQRPVFAAAVVLVWAVQETSTPTGATAGVQNMAAAVGFYLFGDRSLFYIRGGAK